MHIKIFLLLLLGSMKQMKHLEVRRQQLQILPWRSFKQHWELLTVACDQAEEFVESVKQRIGSKCLVDEATGSVTGKRGQPVAGFPPISGVRLKQMSKAVRWLVIELEQGSGNSGGSSHPNTLLPSTPDSQRIQLDSTTTFQLASFAEHLKLFAG